MLASIPVPPVEAIALGGVFLLLLVAVQMLIGYRKIKFKGRTHLKVHKAMAWVLVASALAHGFVGLWYAGILG